MKQKMVYSLPEISSAIAGIKKRLKKAQVVTFTGVLGAGKTTMVKELLKSLGVKERVTSPTFTYMNQYETEAGERIFHFDLYRIKSIQQFIQAGFQEYLYQPNSIVLIEWPELIMPLLTQKVCQVNLEYHNERDKRILTISDTE